MCEVIERSGHVLYVAVTVAARMVEQVDYQEKREAAKGSLGIGRQLTEHMSHFHLWKYEKRIMSDIDWLSNDGRLKKILPKIYVCLCK